jgi:hypothetical protein
VDFAYESGRRKCRKKSETQSDEIWDGRKRMVGIGDLVGENERTNDILNDRTFP